MRGPGEGTESQATLGQENADLGENIHMLGFVCFALWFFPLPPAAESKLIFNVCLEAKRKLLQLTLADPDESQLFKVTRESSRDLPCDLFL